MRRWAALGGSFRRGPLLCQLSARTPAPPATYWLDGWLSPPSDNFSKREIRRLFRRISARRLPARNQPGQKGLGLPPLSFAHPVRDVMRIVGIHGIGQAFIGAAQLKLTWLAAIRDGLSEANEPQIAEQDFEVVGYGSLFRRSESRSVTAPKIDPATLDEFEQALLTQWWQEAARLSASATASGPVEDSAIQGPTFEGRARTPALVQRALRQLSKSRFFRALGGERMLLFELRQVREYLHNMQLKQAILDRVDKQLSANTRVVVSHSLGSVIAYEALCRAESPAIHTLITVGSPLGIRNLVFDALTPKPVNERGAWPRVKRWVNVCDGGDIVALEKSLAPWFGPVADKLVYNGWHSHDALRYLNTREVGKAIADGLK